MIVQLVPFLIISFLTQPEISTQIDKLHMRIIAFTCQWFAQTMWQRSKYDIRSGNHRILITEGHITKLIKARIQFTDAFSGIAFGADGA